MFITTVFTIATHSFGLPPPTPPPTLLEFLESERAVLGEHVRWFEGRELLAEEIGASLLDEADYDEAAGLIPSDGNVAVRLEVSREGLHDEDPTFASSWRIVQEQRHFVSTSERIAALRAARFGVVEHYVEDARASGATDAEIAFVAVDIERTIDEAIARLSGERNDPPERVLSSEDLDELFSREPGAVMAEVCGERLEPSLLPRHYLKLDLQHDQTTDRVALRDRIRAGREAAADHAIDRLMAQLAVFGAVEVLRSRVESCVTVELASHSDVEGASLLPGVRQVRLADRPLALAQEAEFNGETQRLGLQIQQFWDQGFDGDTDSNRPGGFAELTAGIIDSGFQETHVGFLDNSSGGTRRINGLWQCTGNYFGCGGNTCTQYSDLPWQTGHDGYGALTVDHGTTIASIIAGDFLDGQEANTALVPVADRGKFTGFAPEGGFVALQADTCPDRAAAINRGVTLDVDVLSMSVCGGQVVTCGANEAICSHSCTCDGREDDLGDEVNAAFKDGILTMKAAGNQGELTTVNGCCDCTITSPGDVEGAIAVGRTGTGDPDNGTNDVRRATNQGQGDGSSSRGLRELRKNGGTREGAVVGITAPGCHRRGAACQVAQARPEIFCYNPPCPCPTNDIHNYQSQLECGTSYAAPTVAAAGLLMKEEWIATGTPSTWLLQAEIFKLYTLFNGDRTNGDSFPPPKRTFGFSSTFGSGRLRMRMSNGAGMDSPWLNKSAWTNLDDGEVYNMAISSSGSLAPINADIDRLKAMVWWYEPRTEASDATPAAHIVVDLLSYAGPSCSGTPTIERQDYSFDTRKMVFLDLSTKAPGRCYQLRVTGSDVTANDEEGNALVRRTNVVFVAEDNDRDDADGPAGCDASFFPGDCVEPL